MARRHQAKIDRHAHGDEKQPEQQPLEGLDRGLQFMPKLGVGEQHAGEKRAQGHGEAGLLDQQGCADHGQQGRRGEDLAQLS